jgi:signal peptide peptidase SppA
MAFSLSTLFPKRLWRSRPIVPVVRLSGAIGGASPIRAGLSLATLETPLARAFSVRAAPAVAIIINSPGGAAVQSHLIFQRIRALAEETNKRVIVAVEDVAASGGYLIALAGDEIVVDASSIVGSIGVVSAGFGFQEMIAKLGVERRVHTAGENKSMLDPFQPERADDVARLEALQKDVHTGFIDLVKSRRGETLADYPDLFSGAFWSGSRAVALGLADRIGDLRTVLREHYGDEVRLRPIPMGRSLWRRRLGLPGSEGTAATMVDRLISVIEERLLWGRFGL